MKIRVALGGAPPDNGIIGKFLSLSRNQQPPSRWAIFVGRAYDERIPDFYDFKAGACASDEQLHFLLVASCLQVSPVDLQSRRTVASGCYTKLSNPCLDFARLSFPVQLSQ